MSHRGESDRRTHKNPSGNQPSRKSNRKRATAKPFVPEHTEASDRAKSMERGVSMKNGLVRVIGGSLRGRSIEFRTHPGTRPMKDRTRESLFNLLGRDLTGYCVFDLFAGTGILGIESISRGATSATMIEPIKAVAENIRRGAENLGIAESVTVFVADAFRWDPRYSAWNKNPVADQAANENVEEPWIVYFCPPYSFWLERKDEMQQLVDRWANTAPPGSLMAIEFEKPAPLEMLPGDWDWDIREYLPAVMAIGERKTDKPAT